MPVIMFGASAIYGTIIDEDNDFIGLVSDTQTGKGIPGVAVSDGYSVVKTDANGVYQFVVNLWNDDYAHWSVEFTYNGKTTKMERASSNVMDAAAVSYFFNERNKSTTSYAKALEHFRYIQSPDGLDPSEVKGWNITATQVIPGSGERNVYTANTLQTDYTGF